MADDAWAAQLGADIKALGEQLGDMEPAWRAAGEAIREHVEQRFQTSTAPDGSPWAELDPDYAERRKPAKILIQDRTLANSIKTQADPRGIAFGHSVIYGDTHQYGDPDRNIPARPFMPVLPDGSMADGDGTPGGELADEIEETLMDWIDVLDERAKARRAAR